MSPVDPPFPLLNCSSEAPQSKVTSMQILTPQLPLCPVSYFPLETKTLLTKNDILSALGYVLPCIALRVKIPTEQITD